MSGKSFLLLLHNVPLFLPNQNPSQNDLLHRMRAYSVKPCWFMAVHKTSRRDVGFTMRSYQCPRIKLGSALMLKVILILILPRAC